LIHGRSAIVTKSGTLREGTNGDLRGRRRRGIIPTPHPKVKKKRDTTETVESAEMNPRTPAGILTTDIPDIKGSQKSVKMGCRV